MLTLRKYIEKLILYGQYHFTIEEAMKEMNASKSQISASISRAKKKNEIIRPLKNLYIIIPPEHRDLGCLPSQELIPILMQHLKTKYYVALLSAAKYHGASHQKPMLYQVVINKTKVRNIKCGHIRILFTYKQSIDHIPIQQKVVKTGYLNISSPEATAMDILLFPHKCAGLNNVATILSELIETMEPKKLLEMIKLSGQRSWVQRLGYILEQIDTMEEENKLKLIEIIQQYLSSKKLVYVPLSTKNNNKGCSKNEKWMIIENTKIESDL
ncbi:MAG: hypothetical protein GY830_00015 [Bacteroidetes bacterium]|nr:hypothetical protein [Bacteroidota bacterium]